MMKPIVRIYTKKIEELNKFLKLFYYEEYNFDINEVFWESTFDNPTEISDIAAAFVDNKDSFPSCSMWISLDSGVFIYINQDNCNSFIKYLFERYPY